MPTLALILVLAAALLHAGWNLVAKRAGGGQPFILLVALMIVVVWAPVGLWFAWRDLPHWGWPEWALVVASGAAHVVYFRTLLRGYRLADLTVVYPVARGTGPLLTAAVAVGLLGESMSALGVGGVLAVTGGVFLIAGGPALWRLLRGTRGQGAPAGAGGAARSRVLTGIGYGAATGIGIATYTVIDGYAVKVMLMSPILVDYLGNLCRIPFSLPAAVRDPAATRLAWRAQWRHALAVAVMSPMAYVLVLYAMQLAPLSLVAPAREVSMLFAALLGGRLLGEGDRTSRLLGAACIALGVVALGWA